ncbi:MAG: addiction module protein [Tepidiformaceae bacterium]
MTTLESVREAAMSLSPEDREWLAVELALSVDKEPGYEAWAAEIERRIKAIDECRDVPVDWETAEREIVED